MHKQSESHKESTKKNENNTFSHQSFSDRPESLQRSIGNYFQDRQRVDLLLTDCIKTIDSPDIRKSFLENKSFEHEKLQALSEIKSSERVKFLSRLFNLYRDKRLSIRIAAPTIARATHYLSRKERIECCKKLLMERPRYRAGTFLVGILRQSKSLSELSSIIKALDASEIEKCIKFMKRNSDARSDLIDLLTHHKYTRELRKIASSLQPVAPNYSRQNTKNSINKILNALTKANEILYTESSLAKGSVHHGYIKSIGINIESCHQLLFEAKKSDLQQLKENTNLLVQKISLELTYGLLFSNGLSKRWSLSELKQFQSEVCRRVPESILLFTPLLFEAKRVTVSESDQANRDIHGVIRVTDWTWRVAKFNGSYANRSSFELTVLHEIGHCYHYGRSLCDVDVESTNNPSFPGDPFVDYDHYLQLGGWQLIDSTRYRKASSSIDCIVLDGMYDVPLKHPVYFEGRTVVFALTKSTSGKEYLYAYDASANFAPDPLSRSQPAEDLAESFAHYLSNPKGLIVNSPEKFSYFENLIGKYRNSKSLKQFYTQQLELKQRGTLKIGEFENFLLKRFEALTIRQQSFVLYELDDSEGNLQDPTFFPTLKRFENLSQEDRSFNFCQKVRNKQWSELSPVCDVLYSQYSRYKPALLQMLSAAHSFSEIGILTRRENRAQHQRILDALNSFVGGRLERKNIYFVNDSSRNYRLKARSDSGRTFEILRDFARGFYTDENGKRKRLSNRYSKVNFVASDPFLIKELKKRRSKVEPVARKKINLIDANSLSIQQSWSELLDAAWYEPYQSAPRRKQITFFSLDGTLLKSPSHIHVKDEQTGEIVHSIPREEYVEKPDEIYWKKKIARQEKYLASRLLLDLSDIRTADIFNSTPEDMFYQQSD